MNKNVKERIENILELTIEGFPFMGNNKEYLFIYKDSEMCEIYRPAPKHNKYYTPKTPRVELKANISKKTVKELIDYVNTILLPNEMNPIEEGLVHTISQYFSNIKIKHVKILNEDDIIYTARMYNTHEYGIPEYKIEFTRESMLEIFNPDMFYGRYKICLYDPKTKSVKEEVYDTEYGWISLSCSPSENESGVTWKHLSVKDNEILKRNMGYLSTRIREDKNIIILNRYHVIYACPVKHINNKNIL